MYHDETPEARRDRLFKAVEWAGKYAKSFDRELLDHWYRSIVERSLPVNASHAELAADNALRGFVVGILKQYQLATTGHMETAWTPISPQPTPPQPNPPPKRRRKRNPQAS